MIMWLVRLLNHITLICCGGHLHAYKWLYKPCCPTVNKTIWEQLKYISYDLMDAKQKHNDHVSMWNAKYSLPTFFYVNTRTYNLLNEQVVLELITKY